MIKKFITLLSRSLMAAFIYFQLSVGEVLAQTPTGIKNKAISPVLGTDPTTASNGQTFAYYFVYLWRQLINVGGIVVLIYFLWGAFDWLSGGGEKGKIEAARNKMTGALVGFLILVGSFVIISFIEETFKLQILKIQVTSP